MEEINLEYIKKELDRKIEGFTKAFEEQLKNPKKGVFQIKLDNIIDMPTFAFASLAFENNAPIKLIKVIEEMKKRYSAAKLLNRKAYGFLELIEGKAYAYLCLNCKNITEQQKLAKNADLLFRSAEHYGYKEAIYDLAELNAKFGYSYKGESYIKQVMKEASEIHTKIAQIYYDFNTLVKSALRVMEGKRAIITCQSSYNISNIQYRLGMKKNSVTSKFCHGLHLIIDGEKEKGIELVKENFYEVKKQYSKLCKITFASDYKKIEDSFDAIEKKFINIKIK